MKLTRNLLGPASLVIVLCVPNGLAAEKDKKAGEKQASKAQTTAAQEEKGNQGNDNKEWKRGTEGHRPQDLNGDGVITRNEWPGNDASFRDLDRDGDGALTSKDRGLGAEGTGTRMYDRAVNDYETPKKGKSK
jgi:hypothetical protein